jgi:glycine cleavage system H protein
MSNVPTDLKYTRDHEWLRQQDGRVVVGITDHAQKQLGDVVYVELPKVGDTFDAGDALGTVESVKAVSEVYAPISGKVVKVNESLGESPELLNEDPFGEGWIIELQPSDSKQLSELLDAQAYVDYIKEEAAE